MRESTNLNMIFWWLRSKLEMTRSNFSLVTWSVGFNENKNFLSTSANCNSQKKRPSSRLSHRRSHVHLLYQTGDGERTKWLSPNSTWTKRVGWTSTVTSSILPCGKGFTINWQYDFSSVIISHTYKVHYTYMLQCAIHYFTGPLPFL